MINALGKKKQTAYGSNPGFRKRQTSAELEEDGFHVSHFWSETSNFNTRLISQMRTEDTIRLDSLLHLLGLFYFNGFLKMMFLLI